MGKFQKLINKLSHNRKVSLGVILLCLVLMLSILVPTLANFIKEDTSITTAVWDGSIASSYKSGDGTKENPYIISNGSELAYFKYKLAETNYSDTYFSISNNIILNEGTLRYNSESGIEYLLNGTTYYVEYYTNKYYDNPEKNGAEIGTINIFPSLNNFSGHLEGNLHTIFGLYLTESSSENLAFFQNLEGSIQNLFFKNTLVYGGTNTAGLAISSDDVTLNNVLFDGFISNKLQGTSKTITGSLNAESMAILNYETTNYIDLKNKLPFINEIITAKITGNYELEGSSEETNISINGVSVTNGSFSIDLETLTDNISVVTSTTSLFPVTLNFTNFDYEITYNYSLAAGFIANAKNTVLTNVVNATDVSGNFISSGLVGIATGNLKIAQSYNRGKIISLALGAGLIGHTETSDEEINISRSYNSGEILADETGGLLGFINYNLSNLLITNSFEGTKNTPLAISHETGITITNSYVSDSNNTNENFIYKDINELKDETFLKEILEFNKYISDEDFNENPYNIWRYELEEFPLIHYDKIITNVVQLHLESLVYKEYHPNLENKIIKSNITFSLEEVNAFDSIKNKEYFISDSTEILTKEDLNQITSWTNYEEIHQITDEGIYVIYIKITDYKNRVSYLNSDSLILDLTKPEVSLSNDQIIWTEYEEDAEIIYTNKIEKIKINAQDNLSGIAYIKYIIADKTYSKFELSELDENIWNDYNDEILINDLGKQIVYVQVLDNAENITYLNTCYFNYQGYIIENAYVGLGNNPSYLGLPLNITSNSIFTIKIAYEEETPKINENLIHNIRTNILLPKNTEIKIINHLDNKVYSYEISTDEDIYNFNNSCPLEVSDCQKKAKYPFAIFKERGKATANIYEEINYYNNGKYQENFTVILDFSKTSINQNYENVEVYLETEDLNNNLIRSTIKSSIQNINLYSKVNEDSSRAKIYLTTDYLGNPIMLNTNSITEINLTSGINYKRTQEFKIIDTSYEYGNLGFEIKLENSNGETISKEYLKNIAFQIGNENYFMEEDNTVRILGSSIQNETNKTLKIITYEGNSGLDEGNYYFKIKSFKSSGGYIASDSSVSEITLPVIVSKSNYNKSYNIEMDLDSKIINKTNATESVNFTLKQEGELSNKKIKVSLYEKAELTAYNQNYNLVDLKNYIFDSFEHSENYSYIVSEDINFTINFNPEKFNNTGYQLIFELYDGDKRIDLVKKYFIVK